MAKEMTKSLEEDIVTLEKSVREMQAELCQVKHATQYLCTVASQIIQGPSQVRSQSTTTSRGDSLSEPSSIGRPIIE